MSERRQGRRTGSTGRARRARAAEPRTEEKPASKRAESTQVTTSRTARRAGSRVDAARTPPTGKTAQRRAPRARPARPGDVDAYTQSLGGWRADVMVRLRAILASAAPDARELIRGGHPRYDDNGPLCYIRASDDRIEMGFWRGEEMPDPRGLLTDGPAPRMRRLVVTGPELVRRRERALKSLVRSAVRLNRLFGDPTQES